MRYLPSSKIVAEEFPDTPRWQRLLIRLRFLLAGIYLLSVGGLVVWLAMTTISELTAQNIIAFAIMATVLFAGQAMLLAGAPQFRPSRPVRRRHKAVSLIAGALAAGALTFGFVATITSLLGHRLTWISIFGESIQPFVVLIGLPWLFWLLVFGLLWFNRWSSGFGKMYRLLVAGTFAEVLFTIPVDVMVRRRTSCYCDEGTFAALIVGTTTAVWTFGPGIAILFLLVRLRRRQRKGYCLKCGYDLRGLPSNRCPECGTEFEQVDNAVAV